MAVECAFPCPWPETPPSSDLEVPPFTDKFAAAFDIETTYVVFRFPVMRIVANAFQRAQGAD